MLTICNCWSLTFLFFHALKRVSWEIKYLYLTNWPTYQLNIVGWKGLQKKKGARITGYWIVMGFTGTSSHCIGMSLRVPMQWEQVPINTDNGVYISAEIFILYMSTLFLQYNKQELPQAIKMYVFHYNIFINCIN